jgi:hypothetical protein
MTDYLTLAEALVIHDDQIERYYGGFGRSELAMDYLGNKKTGRVALAYILLKKTRVQG